MKLKGLATGIGSLPHKDAEAALDLIFQYIPHAPFWPQLPKRDRREGMVAQFSENIPFLKSDQDGLKFDSAGAGDCRLEEFYEKIINNDIEHFKISAEFASGLHKFYQRLKSSNLKDVQFIKCQVTGPFTFAASVKDDTGNALLYNPVLMQAIVKALVAKSLWQIKLFQGFGKKLILFIDEPYLGCFGSAYTPLNRADVVGALREMTEGIKQSGDVLIGLHCCGNTDWSIFTEVKTIDMISFDAFEYLDRVMLYADNLKEFTSRG
ncbi:MAG: methionine synthase [Candidatus Omnitrophica bacterium]|nr:methionine synthase [Candidatus Omnitrophota bacterium]